MNTQQNTNGFSFGSFGDSIVGSIGDLWNDASRVFDRIVDFEIGKYEAEAMADVRRLEQSGRDQQIQSYSGTNNPYVPPQTSMAIDQKTLMGIGVVALALILIMRK